MEAISGVLTTRIEYKTKARLNENEKTNAKIITNRSFIKSNLFLASEEIYIKDLDVVSKYKLHIGDVVIMCFEPFKVAYISEEGIIATSALYKVVDDKLTSKQIFKLLNSKAFRNYLNKSIEGTSLKRLSSKHITKFKYSERDYENADMYFEIRKLIDNNVKELEKLEKLEDYFCQ